MLLGEQMRVAYGLLLLACTSACASSVQRLDGEVPTRAGPAKNACEERDWLVVSPTRAALVDAGAGHSSTRKDGVAFYRIGADEPVAIPTLADDMGGGASFARHGRAVRSYDQRQLWAGGLGAVGVITIAIGTALFVNAFGTERTATGEHQKIDATRAALGGAGVGLGFGLGVAGLIVSPSHAERTRAEAARYVYLPPEDPATDVLEMASRYNQAVRERCVERARP